VFLNGGPIAWASKQQAIVALSTAEAEYIVLGFASWQVLWFHSLSQELGFPQQKPSIIYCDNQGAIYCTHDPKSHSHMKHIDIRYHFICHCVNQQLIDVVHIPGVSNMSDVLTKALDTLTHEKWASMLNLHWHVDPGGML
jgi:hypothetical protein